LVSADTKITLVAYSVPEPGWSKVIPAFNASAEGKGVQVVTSYAASADQSRGVVEGKPADVVNFSVEPDITRLVKAGKVSSDWDKGAGKGNPFGSVVTLVVRKGNPKNIRDWDDLARPGVSVITPNPKTSGGARWNYLAAWEYGKRKYGGEAKAKEFVAHVFANVPVLDTGARGSTITFAQRSQGDVLIAWENEAWLLQKEFAGKVDIVYPTLSILAEPPVAVVDRNVDKRHTRAIAEEYLKYLYTEEGQDIIGRNFYRPAVSKAAQAKYAKQFPKLNLFTIDEAFGGWAKADKDHFADGGSFDQVYTRK
jgi:sulfate transport system substrate-binding protein